MKTAELIKSLATQKIAKEVIENIDQYLTESIADIENKLNNIDQVKRTELEEEENSKKEIAILEELSKSAKLTLYKRIQAWHTFTGDNLRETEITFFEFLRDQKLRYIDLVKSLMCKYISDSNEKVEILKSMEDTSSNK